MSVSQIWWRPGQITTGCFVIYSLCAKLLIKSRLNESWKAFEKRSSATNTGQQENAGHTFSLCHMAQKKEHELQSQKDQQWNWNSGSALSCVTLSKFLNLSSPEESWSAD